MNSFQSEMMKFAWERTSDGESQISNSLDVQLMMAGSKLLNIAFQPLSTTQSSGGRGGEETPSVN